MNIFPLSKAPLGKKVVFLNMNGCSSSERRLSRLGFVRGAEIIPLHKSIGGDPRAYYINGLVAALRSCDAKNMLVCPAEECK